MKKSLKYTFLAFALVVSFGIAGCSDFLDLKPKGKEVPTKLEHYNGLFFPSKDRTGVFLPEQSLYS